jgi:predicted small secreted protein
MKTKHTSLMLLLCAAILALTTVGCRNTAQGVGKDVEKVGEKIQEKTR